MFRSVYTLTLTHDVTVDHVRHNNDTKELYIDLGHAVSEWEDWYAENGLPVTAGKFSE